MSKTKIIHSTRLYVSLEGDGSLSRQGTKYQRLIINSLTRYYNCKVRDIPAHVWFKVRSAGKRQLRFPTVIEGPEKYVEERHGRPNIVYDLRWVSINNGKVERLCRVLEADRNYLASEVSEQTKEGPW